VFLVVDATAYQRLRSSSGRLYVLPGPLLEVLTNRYVRWLDFVSGLGLLCPNRDFLRSWGLCDGPDWRLLVPKLGLLAPD